MPIYPSAAGTCTSSTSSRTSDLSGVTISSTNFVGIAIVIQEDPGFRLRASGVHPPGLFDGFLDGADHVERLLRELVVLALDDLLEPADGVRDRHVLPLEAGELLGHEERLREKALDLARARHGQLVVLGELVDAENRDDVLQ